jgi:hypothetical protein
MSRRRPYDVAIVGMGCRLAGAADLFAFWADSLAGRDSGDRAPTDQRPPIDEVVRAALADAGLDAERASEDDVEVVVGLGKGCDHDAIGEDIDELNWASASLIRGGVASIGAVDLASCELIARRAGLAVAVGVTVEQGVGAVVLKRLADAERDGDRVYAIVKQGAGRPRDRGADRDARPPRRAAGRPRGLHACRRRRSRARRGVDLGDGRADQGGPRSASPTLAAESDRSRDVGPRIVPPRGRSWIGAA